MVVLSTAASCSQAIPGVDETRFDVRIPADRSAGVRVSISNCRARCMRTPAVTAVCMLDHTTGELNWQLDGVPNCTGTLNVVLYVLRSYYCGFDGALWSHCQSAILLEPLSLINCA